MSIQEKRDARNALVTQARNILNGAEAEGRSITADEEQSFDAIMADADSMSAAIERESRLNGFDADLAETRTRITKFEPSMGMNTVAVDDAGTAASASYRSALNTYLRYGDRHELRALEVGTASEGGNIVDDKMAAQIVQKADEMSFVRGLSRVITTSSDMKIPVESTAVTAAIVAEEGAVGETDPAFGSTTLASYKFSCLVKCSIELLQDAEFDLSSYLAESFGRAFGKAEDQYFLAGTGSGQPTGVVSTSGVGATTAASATAITADEVIDVYHALSNEYRRGESLAWAAADATLKIIRKLKDGDNQYLWQPGLQMGQPDMLLGIPVYANSNMPAATTGLKSLCVANYDYFYIADRGSVGVQRLDELYAGNGQIGFIATKRMDGALVQGAAGSVLTMA